MDPHNLAAFLLNVTRDEKLGYLTARELALLVLLRTGPQRATRRPWGTLELASVSGMSKPAITRSVSRLVIEKLAANATSPRDKRRRCITLTPYGVETVDRLMPVAAPEHRAA